MGIVSSNSFSQESTTINNLEKVLLTEEDTLKKMDILIELTDLLISSDLDRALTLANQTVNLATENDSPQSKVVAWIQIGKIYKAKNNYRLSMDMANKAKKLAYELDLDIEYANSLILLSMNFTLLGDFEKSTNLNFQALKIFEDHNDKKGIGEAFNQIGFAHFEQENFEKAFEYYTQSLTIAREIKDLPGISRGLNNVAIVYASMGDYKNVKTNIKESIEINKILDRQLWVGVNYLNLGLVYRMEEIYDSSFLYLNKSSHIFIEMNNLQKISAAYYALSRYYSDIGKLDSSLYYAKQTYEIGQENNLKKTIYNGAILQRNIYQLQKDYENAFKYSMIESEMKDSLDIQESMTRFTHLELLHEFDKLEQENKIKQQRRESIMMVTGIAIVFILVIIVIIIITRNRLKRKNEQIERRRLNMELELKNKELAANVMTLIRKNEILSEMGDKLMDVQNNAVKEETKSAIKKIARELRKTTDNEIWDEFDIRFKQVHGEFYDKLLKQFPDLSPNEHRLCAFLRLNMSSKEIAELTGQRIDTLEIARWRLRKKLNITNTKTNLVTFLSEI